MPGGCIEGEVVDFDCAFINPSFLHVATHMTCQENLDMIWNDRAEGPVVEGVGMPFLCLLLSCHQSQSINSAVLTPFLPISR